MESSFVQGVPRGCGNRKQGGVYAECGSSREGKPVESFLLCPPIPVDPKEFGITAVGVKLIEGMVWDWVGSQYYQNVTDFIEEVRRFGMSRRLPKTFDFQSLIPTSRMFLLHSRAHIENPTPYHSSRLGGKVFDMKWDWCPTGRHDHTEKGMCAGLWWEDIVKDGLTLNDDQERVGVVDMPAFSYLAAETPIENAEHTLAIFASFPIQRLAVIRAEDGSHNETADRASASAIPVEVVDE